MTYFKTFGKLRYGIIISLLGFLLCFCGCATRFDAYIVSKESEKLTVLDFAANKLLLEVEGSPFTTGADPSDLAYDPRHRRIYVTNSGENTLSVYRIRTVYEDYFRSRDVLEPLDKIETREEPISVAVDTRHNLVCVLHRDGTLLWLKGEDLTFQRAKKIFYATNPYPEAAGIAYDARNDLIYAIDQAADALVILEGKSRKYVKVVPTGSRPSAVAYDYRNNRVYVTNLEDNTLSVYEAGPFCELIETIEVGFLPSDVAYDDRQNLIFIPQSAVNEVSVFDAEDLELVTQIDLPGGTHPVSVATGFIEGASASLVYVAKRREPYYMGGNVSVFEIRDRDNFVPVPDSPINVPESPVGIATTQPVCPEILSLSAEEAHVGETVTIIGIGFGDQQGLSQVEFGGVVATEILSWSTSEIQVKVPPLAESGVVRVIVRNCSSGPPDGKLVKEFTVTPHAHIYVDARHGNNLGGDGTQSNPYKTISYALSKAVASDVIHIYWGHYDRALGEVFPLRIKEGVHLEREGGGHATIKSHRSAIEMAEGTSIEGVWIEGEESNSRYTSGIVCQGNSVIYDCVISNFEYGIKIEDKNRSSIINTHISHNEYGIWVTGGANPIIEDNYVFDNDTGVNLWSSAYLGSNDIRDNRSNGIIIGPDSSVILAGNYIYRNAYRGIVQSLTNTLCISFRNAVERSDIGISVGNAVIIANEIRGNDRIGVEVGGDGRCIIYDSYIEYNGLVARAAPAIHLRGSSSCLIENNSIRGNYAGMYAGDACEAVIVRNYIMNNEGSGITISSESMVQVGGSENEGNRIEGNGAGIWVTGSPNVKPLISYNQITNNRTGVASCANAKPSLFDNRIEDNDWGVVAWWEGNPFLGSLENPGNNIIRNNNYVGLYNNECEAIVIQAVGNTWNPNTQGADYRGEYSHQKVYGPVPWEEGNNYAIAGEEAAIDF